MAKASDILGLNARESMYRKMNSGSARKYSNSKLAAKALLVKHGIGTPALYARFKTLEDVDEFSFLDIKSSFVIKPVGGNGGNGVLVVKKPSKIEGRWIDINNKNLSEADLKLHTKDILEGIYSTYGTAHEAFVEERVGIHPKFRRYTKRGTPDIRVLVFNSVPIMAMLRLPTKESGGRANLHQGAIGAGIDIATGITLKGVLNGKIIRYLPDTKRKINGIKIPKWKSVLMTAVEACRVAEFEFCGVDLFIHADKGPMVVELNANPGLGIQLANSAGLKRRLERVAGLKIRNTDHGVRVGRSLFAEWFADKVKAEDGVTLINTFEKVRVRSKDKKWHEIDAKVDTGAFRSAIDRGVAEELGLLGEDNVLWEGRFRHSYGREKRPVVEARLFIKGKKLNTAMSVANRSKMSAKVLIGRRDLEGFLVNPQLRKE